MNYAVYMRRVAGSQKTYLAQPSGQDASQVTLKARAVAATGTRTPQAVEFKQTKVGGAIGNIMQPLQQNNVPTSFPGCADGALNIAKNMSVYDGQATVVESAAGCAVCSDQPSSAPYKTELPCETFLDPVGIHDRVVTCNGPPMPLQAEVVGQLILDLPINNCNGAFVIFFFGARGATSMNIRAETNRYISQFFTKNLPGEEDAPPFIGFLCVNIDEFEDNWNGRFILEATNDCGTTYSDAFFFCFPAGSPVTMEDGSTKAIETIRPGEKVRGAFGEANTVIGYQRGQARESPLITINGNHRFFGPHTHIGADKKIYTTDISHIREHYYGKSGLVITAEGLEQRTVKGVDPSRLRDLKVGSVLKTVDGEEVVTSIEKMKVPPLTPMYHLVVDGSHTFCVNKFAVTGWVDESDFDYDTWTARVAPLAMPAAKLSARERKIETLRTEWKAKAAAKKAGFKPSVRTSYQPADMLSTPAAPSRYVPGPTKCCVSPGIKFVDTNQELVKDQARQATLRQQYGLPSKLQGLRGPVVNGRPI